MTDPATMEDYTARFYAGLRYEGVGFELRCHTPCPFCAAPDFAAWRVLMIEDDMQQEAVCRECGRGSRAIVVRSKDGVSFRIVQTRGDDPPPYIPKLQRESTDA